jgi:thioredoxin reductase (NADPH)
MISLDRLKRKSYDIAIVGAGPAGISAAINGAVRKKEVLLIDKLAPMNKIEKAEMIPNYPGLPGIKGPRLKKAFLDHLAGFNIKIETSNVSKIVKMGKRLTIYTKKDVFEAKSAILCTGIVREKKIKGENELIGKGVSYCVTCDGLLYQGEKVGVISDLEEGEYEAKTLDKEYDCDVIYIPGYKIENPLPDSITVINKKPLELKRKGAEIEISLEGKNILVKGVFIIREGIPPATIMVRLETKGGYVSVNNKMETSIKGVFAAGDCTGPPFQIAKAVGQGQVAALSAVKYLR